MKIKSKLQNTLIITRPQARVNEDFLNQFIKAGFTKIIHEPMLEIKYVDFNINSFLNSLTSHNARNKPSINFITTSLNALDSLKIKASSIIANNSNYTGNNNKGDGKSDDSYQHHIYDALIIVLSRNAKIYARNLGFNNVISIEEQDFQANLQGLKAFLKIYAKKEAHIGGNNSSNNSNNVAINNNIHIYLSGTHITEDFSHPSAEGEDKHLNRLNIARMIVYDAVALPNFTEDFRHNLHKIISSHWHVCLYSSRTAEVFLHNLANLLKDFYRITNLANLADVSDVAKKIGGNVKILTITAVCISQKVANHFSNLAKNLDIYPLLDIQDTKLIDDILA